MNTFICICIYTYECVYTYIYINICIYTHMYIHEYIRTYKHMLTGNPVSTHTCIFS